PGGSWGAEEHHAELVGADPRQSKHDSRARVQSSTSTIPPPPTLLSSELAGPAKQLHPYESSGRLSKATHSARRMVPASSLSVSQYVITAAPPQCPTRRPVQVSAVLSPANEAK